MVASGRGGGGGHGTLSAFTALSSELVLEILQLLDDAALRNAGESCRLLGALEATEWQQLRHPGRHLDADFFFLPKQRGIRMQWECTFWVFLVPFKGF